MAGIGNEKERAKNGKVWRSNKSALWFSYSAGTNTLCHAGHSLWDTSVVSGYL
jgi:hypothetical protein